MNRVVLMCGPAGSGKTTVARRLANSDGMVRLSVDDEAWARGLRSHPIPVQDAEEIDAFLRDRLVALIGEHRDVIVDFSFATRAARDDYRDLVAPFSIVPEVIYVDTPRDIALGRIRARRGSGANDVVLSDDTARRYYDEFDVPTADEGPLTVVSGG